VIFMGELEKFKDQVYICDRCGECVEICPVYEATKGKSYSAEGAIMIARAILSKRLSYTDPVIERIYACATCKYCEEICPPKIRLVDIYYAMRKDSVKTGIGPIGIYRTYLDCLKKKHNIYGESEESRARKIIEALNIPASGDTIYFTGCMSSYDPGTLEIGLATAKILRETGVEFAMLGGKEWCCGWIPLVAGDKELLNEMAHHNVEALEKAGAKEVITSCSMCYGTIKLVYPEIVGNLPFKLSHTSMYFSKLLDEGKLKPKRGVKKKVTLHDGCYLGRYGGTYEPPRNVIKSIPEIQLIEMKRNKKNARCCGGAIFPAYPEFALKIGQSVLKDAIDGGAEVVVGVCPLCHKCISMAAEKGHSHVSSYDLSMLVAEAMGLAYR